MAAKFSWMEKFTKVLEKVPECERGNMALAIIEYGTYGTEPSLEFPYDAIFESVREDIDNSVNARSSNAGGRPRKRKADENEHDKTPVIETENGGFETDKRGFSEAETQTIPSHTNPSQSNSGGKARFAPPSPEDVEAYASEKGLDIDADRFCDFYASKGWKVGKSPMKDWRAAARNWARRDKPKEDDYGIYGTPF